MTTLQSATKTKAVKDHICNFCGHRINKGDHYMKSTHVDDEIYDWKAHEHCEEISHRLKMYDVCDHGEGLTADHFQEIICDEYTELMRAKSEEGYLIFKTEFQSVVFRHKLGTVIRHYKKLDKQIKQ